MAKTKKKSPLPISLDPNYCEKIMTKVEATLQRQCKRKKKKLLPCCTCNPKIKGPKIRSQSDGILLNTAYRGPGSTTAPPGPDTFWEFSSTLSGTYNPAPVSGNPIPGSWNGPAPQNADWLSNVANANPGRRRNVFFRIKFSLCNGINPHDFKLNVNYLVDDTIREIYVNGVAQSGKTNIPTGGFRNLSSVKLEDDWQHCENEIIFHVNSTQTYLGFIAGFSIDRLPTDHLNCECKCRPAELPKYEPCFTVSYADRKRDVITGHDCEVLCITACNCYSNITFQNLTIPQIIVCDENGKPIKGTISRPAPVQVIPAGPICFGDLGPCKPGRKQNCISRQVVIKTYKAKPVYYRLKFEPICYTVAFKQSISKCFEIKING